MTQTTNVGALPEKLKLRIGVSYRANVSAWDENTAEPLTQSVRWRTNLLRRSMRSNSALERSVSHHGPRLAAAWSSWPAAQRDR